MTRYFGKQRGLICADCGRTFNEHSSESLCPECFEVASYDNQCNDSDEPLSNSEVLHLSKLLKAINEKGGNAKKTMDYNESIDWTLVPIAATQTRVGNDTRATNGVKAPVNVDGVTYRSVRHAFVALGFPLSKHQAFRKQLKSANDGAMFFEHNGHRYFFLAAGWF